MLVAGVDRVCFVISPGKTDIISYFGGRIGDASICYVVQQNPNGLCDAVFKALPFIARDDRVLVGLPDTLWFPVDGFTFLPDGELSFLLFPVVQPELFDAVVTDHAGFVEEIQVKQRITRTPWVWGAFKLTGAILASLDRLWRERGEVDEYWGTLVNAYIARQGKARGVKRGDTYVDVGSLHGYREAVRVLSSQVALDAVEP
jgi:glucose-1-phosphate thymidylyltransferase